MRKLLVYLKPYTKETILAPLFKMLEASFELIVPLVVAALIDKGIAGKDTGYMLKMGLILVLLAAVGFVSSITAQYFAAKASAGFAKIVRHELFNNIQSLSYSQIDELGTSTMITRMTSDMNQVQQGVNLTLRLLLRSPFIVFGAMIMAFTISVKEALIFVVTIPLLSVVVFGIMLWSIPKYKIVQEKLDRVLGLTRENLEGVRVIRAFGNEEKEKATFFAGNNELTNIQKHVGSVTALMNPLTYVILNMAICYLIYTGAISVQAGILTQGSVVALYNYMSQILVELVKLANLILNITRAVACGNRIESLMEIEPSMKDGDITYKSAAAGAEDYIFFDHAGMMYPGDNVEALTDVNLHVRKGESIGIIGGTGSGKSTLVNLIPRFYDVNSGAVYINGKNVNEYNTESLREHIGVVPQKAVLFKGTVRDNMKWGRENVSDEEIYEALEVAQAKEVVEGKDGKLDFVIAQGGKNLSGGQKQRLTIARALVRKPDILILDDSASALDFVTDYKLRTSIKNMADAPTTFIVSQRTASIKNCDKIVVLDAGEVVGIGTHDDLLKNCEVYREIYDSQFKKQKGGN
ncbi:MAG: ABC transporter ATP-binding protein/permease [Butyrivibrio sp.]|nr:ABC transporter ATP-binding protein/permease [Butyrivibrio sp.]